MPARIEGAEVIDSRRGLWNKVAVIIVGTQPAMQNVRQRRRPSKYGSAIEAQADDHAQAISAEFRADIPQISQRCAGVFKSVVNCRRNFVDCGRLHVVCRSVDDQARAATEYWLIVDGRKESVRLYGTLLFDE